jgi:hypothetical protein
MARGGKTVYAPFAIPMPNCPLKKAVAQASLPADSGEATALFQRAANPALLRFVLYDIFFIRRA